MAQNNFDQTEATTRSSGENSLGENVDRPQGVRAAPVRGSGEASLSVVVGPFEHQGHGPVLVVDWRHVLRAKLQASKQDATIQEFGGDDVRGSSALPGRRNGQPLLRRMTERTRQSVQFKLCTHSSASNVAQDIRVSCPWSVERRTTIHRRCPLRGCTTRARNRLLRAVVVLRSVGAAAGPNQPRPVHRIP